LPVGGDGFLSTRSVTSLCRSASPRATRESAGAFPVKTSIQTRLIVATNAVVLVLCVTMGWLGMHVAGRVIEDRLVKDAVVHAAELVDRLRLPLSNALMTNLRQILDAELAAAPTDAQCLTGSSLSKADADAFLRCAAAGPVPAKVRLGQTEYRVGTAVVATAPVPIGTTGPMRLYLLTPTARILAAKRQATAPIAGATVVAVIVATAISSWLSSTISRPVRDLAGHMETLTHESVGTASLGPASVPAELRDSLHQGPAEMTQLIEAFDRLLRHLHEVRAQLVQSERLTALGELATSIAHECRNPLSGIKMNARVLADELARAGVKDDRSVELIIREIDRLDLYFGELLNFATGGTRPHTAATDTNAESATRPVADLEEAATSVLRLLDGRCRHAQVEVSRKFDAATRAVAADPGELRQVLLNLCLNALDAMPNGGNLTVGAECTGAEAVRVCVADTGTGVRVAPELDIFGPFVSTKPHGAGLGLHICRKIVERRGGRIGYDSLQKGSRFWFELPMHR